MNWQVVYLPEVEKDFRALSRDQALTVRKAIEKVRQNPLPQSEGGYGKPLGNKRQNNLLRESLAMYQRLLFLCKK